MIKIIRINLFVLFTISFHCIYAINTDTLKATDYINMAEISLQGNDYGKTRELSLKALEINPNIGKAYILIGMAYIKSIDSCSNDLLERSMIFCLAMDKFEKAKQVDTSVVDKSNELIDIYLKYLPSKEEMYIDELVKGMKYKIGCWINEETIVRFIE